jgi:L-ribulokinase
MQIYADVTGRPMKISCSAQTCALGAAIAGAVVAGKKAGGHDRFADAQKAMTGLKPRVYKPSPEAHAVYKDLYSLYRKLHDAFGTETWTGNLHDVMKRLIQIRDRVRK